MAACWHLRLDRMSPAGHWLGEGSPDGEGFPLLCSSPCTHWEKRRQRAAHD
jgi:hypothetical protein